MSQSVNRHLVAAHRILLEISSLSEDQQRRCGDVVVSLSRIVTQAADAQIPHTMKVSTK